jgi:hypothetical protein
VKLAVTALLVVTGTAALFAGPPSLPTTPAPVEALVLARPFALEQGFRFDWRRERPLVKEGYLLVLEVDPHLVYPRQTLEPVLYVGNQTAMRLNVGYPSGRVVAVVPSSGELTHIWFGTPRLPERVTAAIIADERSLAHEKGIPRISAETVQAALDRGGPPAHAEDFNALLGEAARMVETYAPDERALAEILASQGK